MNRLRRLRLAILTLSSFVVVTTTTLHQLFYFTQLKPYSVVSRTRKPLFVLHIGPYKTGTTSIQQFAADNHEFMMREDSFLFLGSTFLTGNGTKLYFDTRQALVKGRSDLMDDLLKRVDNALLPRNSTSSNNTSRTNNTLDFFLSEEMISAVPSAKNKKATFDRFVNFLQEREGQLDVRVILSYRWCHQLFSSEYSQRIYTHFWSTKRSEEWPGDRHDTSRLVQALPAYFAIKGGCQDYRTIFKTWESAFKNVQVYDYHHALSKNPQATKTNGMLQDFYCTMIPEAEHTCHLLSAGDAIPQQNSGAAKTDKRALSDQLAVEAYLRGWYPSKHDVSRRQARLATQLFVKDNFPSSVQEKWPKTCLNSNQRNDLLNLTLELDNFVVQHAERLASSSEAIRSDFDKYVESGRFCSHDVASILDQNQSAWKNFFGTSLHQQ